MTLPSNHFSFWQPVILYKETPAKKDYLLSGISWHIGNLADQILYLGKENINIRIYKQRNSAYDIRKSISSISTQYNVLKVSLYGAMFFATYLFPAAAIIPCTLLATKMAFKHKLNQFMQGKVIRVRGG